MNYIGFSLDYIGFLCWQWIVIKFYAFSLLTDLSLKTTKIKFSWWSIEVHIFVRLNSIETCFLIQWLEWARTHYFFKYSIKKSDGLVFASFKSGPFSLTWPKLSCTTHPSPMEIPQRINKYISLETRGVRLSGRGARLTAGVALSSAA